MFNPQHWLRALSDLGGGYALTADRRLVLLVDRCPADHLAPVMAQIIGRPDRQEELKLSIEQRQQPEVKS
jgi:hypothetical protein